MSKTIGIIVLAYLVISPFVPLKTSFENKSCRYQVRSYQTRIPSEMPVSNTLRMAIESRDSSLPPSRRLIDCQSKDWTELLPLRLNPINRIQSF